MPEEKFNPNVLTFEEGLKRLHRILAKEGLDPQKRITTSRDEKVANLREVLKVTNVPKGFQKWMLPVYMTSPSQLYISVAEPHAEVPLHSHDEGDGIRFMISGSINYNGQELTAGDWMYIPKGAQYSMKAGPFGAAMCYCYCCCCGGREDFLGAVVDPAP
ncbi:MAG: cupin domain-containing protein [Ktedonobacteraceae bacterium]